MDKQAKEMEMVQFASQEIPLMNEYPVYRRRYMMAAFFSFATICSSMMFAATNPVSSDLSLIYNIPPFVVSLAANGFLLMHPALTFAQTYLVDLTNISYSLKFGCALTLGGAALRACTLITGRFFTVILGSFVGGMGRPFIINIQANVAKEWFRPSDKTTVMMAFSFIITCSNILGVIIPAEVFHGYIYNDNQEQGKELTGKLMLVDLEIFTLFLVPVILFFQATPPTPPGPINKNRDEFTYWQSLRITFSNKSFILLFICYSLVMGGFHALATVISYLFAPFGFNATQISYIQSAPIICGFVSSVGYSIMIKKYKLNLQKVVQFNLVPVLFTLGTAYLSLKTQNFYLVLIEFAVLGFFMIPCIPLQLELACRVLYPINQSIAVGFLLAGVHLWSFIFGELLALITDDQTKDQSFHGCMTLFASFVVAAICFSMVKVPKEEEIQESTDSQVTASEGAI